MTDTPIERLKGCPFCGPGTRIRSSYVTGMVSLWRVGCTTCGVNVEIGCKPFDEPAREQARVVAEERWNTRATIEPIPSAGEGERLERLVSLARELMATFVPTDEERAAIRELAADLDIPERAVMRQALRLYQLHHMRLKAGETFSFSGDAQRAAEFAALATLPSEPLRDD